MAIKIDELDKFCVIYNEDNLLDEKSVIEVMFDLQAKAEDLKKQISNPFDGGLEKNKINDEVIFDAINNLNYDRNADVYYIDRWLNEFKINLKDIKEGKLGTNKIEKYISVRVKDFKGSSKEKEKARLIQAEFLDFFLKLYADDFLIYGFKNKSKYDWQYIKSGFINYEALNTFGESIYNKKNVTNSNLYYINDLGNKLISEIRENFIDISDFKRNIYIEQIIDVLEKRQNSIPFSLDCMNKWVSKYSLDMKEYPNFRNVNLNEVLNQSYCRDYNTLEERKEAFQMKTDFYLYSCAIETKEIIDYLNNFKKKDITPSLTNQEKKLSIKQIALKLAYEGINVSKENANEIINEYGYTSGQKLYQEFNKVWKIKNRISDPDDTLKVLQNKIALFESVAENLSPELQHKAYDEIKTLKSYIAKYQ